MAMLPDDICWPRWERLYSLSALQHLYKANTLQKLCIPVDHFDDDVADQKNDDDHDSGREIICFGAKYVVHDDACLTKKPHHQTKIPWLWSNGDKAPR